jgi:hypothetical protein
MRYKVVRDALPVKDEKEKPRIHALPGMAISVGC